MGWVSDQKEKFNAVKLCFFFGRRDSNMSRRFLSFNLLKLLLHFVLKIIYYSDQTKRF